MQPVAWPFTLLGASTIANQRIGSISVDQDELHVLCVSSSGDASSSSGSAASFFGSDANSGVEARVSADTPRPTLTVVGQTLRMESDGSVRHVDNFQHYLDVSSLVGNNPGRICSIAPDSLKRERERLPRRVVYTAEASSGTGGSGASKSAAATNAMNLGLAQMNATVRLVSRTQLSARVTVTVVSSAGAPMSAPSMPTSRSAGVGSNNNSTLVSSATATEKALFECVWDAAGPSPMAYENGLRRINLTAFGSKRLQRGTTTLQVVAGRNWSDRRFLLANQLAPMGRDLHLSGTVFTLSALASANASSSGGPASAPPPPPSSAPSSPASIAAKAAADVAAANHVLNTNSLRIHAGAPSTALSAAVASAANSAASIAAAAAASKNQPPRGSVALVPPRSPYNNGNTAQSAFFEGTAPLSFDRFSDANLVLAGANSPLSPSSSSSFSNAAAVVVSGSVSATRTLQVVRVWYDAEYPDCVVVLTRAAASSALELCVSAIDRDHTFFPAANASPVVSLAAMSAGGGGGNNNSQNNAANASAFGGASAAGSAVVQKIDIQRFFASDSMLQANDLCDENSRAFIVGEQTGVVGHASSIKRVVLCFSTRSSSATSDASIISGGSGSTPLSSSHLRPQRFALIRAERNSLCSSFPAVFTSGRALSYAFLRRSDLVAVASPLEECVTLVDSIFPRVVLKCSVRQLVRCLGSGPCPANAAAVENISLRTWSCSGGGAWDLRHERLVVFWNSPTQRLPRYSSPYNANNNSNNNSSSTGNATAASSGLAFPSAPLPRGATAAAAGKPPLRMQSSLSLDNGSDVMPPLQGSPSSRVGGGCDETMTNASSVPRQQLQRAPSGTFCVLDLSADELVSSVRSLLLPTLQTRLAARSAAHMLYITPRLPRNKNSGSGAGGGGLSAVAPAAGSALPLARIGDLVSAFRAGTALSRWGATALSGWIDAEIRSRYDSAPLRSVTEDHPIVLLPLSQLVSMIIYSQHSAALRDQQRQRELEVQQERLLFLQRQQYNNQLHPGSLLSPTQAPLGVGAGQQQQQPLVMTDELLQRLRHEERLEHAAGRSIPMFRDPASAAVAAAATSGGGGGDTGLRDEAQRYAQRLLKQQQKKDKAAKAASPTSAAPAPTAAAAVKPRPQPKPEPTPEHLRPQEQQQQQFPSAPVSPTLEEFETSKFVLEVLEAMRLVWARLVGPLMEEHNAEKRKAAAAAAATASASTASTWSPAHAAELLHLANVFSEACELSALGLDGGFGSELALDVAGEVRALLSALIYDNRRALRSVLPLPAIARMHLLFGASSSAATARSELSKQIQAHHGSARVFGLRQERADAAWAAATPARMNRQRRQQEQQSPSERRILPHSPPPRVSAFADRARERRAAIAGGNITAAAFVRLH